MAYLLKMTMTSQKRFRHHHDNNAAARFRDLPPRFKRQKSSSSPKPATETDPVDQENEYCRSSPAFRSVSPQLNQISIDSSHYTHSPNCESAPYTHTPNCAMKQPLRTYNRPDPQAWSPNTKEDALLHVDTSMLKYALRGSHAGEYLVPPSYCTPPPSPWGIDNGQNNSTSDVLLPSEISTYPSSLQSSPALVDSRDIMSPYLEMARTPYEDVWVDDPLIEGSPVEPNTQTVTNQNSPAKENEEKRSVDLSDPDIRTIEMLRELERVADQKEKEDESDSGVDRKNLVSHHLRMLMCAVDRYTADIEEDNHTSQVAKEDSRPPSVDVTPATSVRSPPGRTDPVKSNGWTVKQSKKQANAARELPQRKNGVLQGSKMENMQVPKPSVDGTWSADTRQVQNQSRNNQWSGMAGQSRPLYNEYWTVSSPPPAQGGMLLPMMSPTKVLSTPPPPSLSTPPPPTRQILSTPSRTPSPHPPPAPRAITSAKPATQQATTHLTGGFVVNSCHRAAVFPSAAQTVVNGNSIQQLQPEPVWGPLYPGAWSESDGTGWNIWSSPSFFNVSGPADYVGMAKERKPLYKR